MEKTTQKKRERDVKLVEDDGKSRQSSSSSSFNKRKSTLKNKARELATLCDVMVCLVCYGPDGKVDTWPEDKTRVHDMIKRYKEHRETPLMMKKAEEMYDLLDLLESKRIKLMDKKKEFVEKLFSILETKIDQYSVEGLGVLCNDLDSKLQKLRERIELLQIEENQKAVQFNNINGGECSYNQQEAVFAATPVWPGVYANLLMGNNDFGRQESLFPLCQNYQNNIEIDNTNNYNMLPDNRFLPGFELANPPFGAHENFPGSTGGPYYNDFDGGPVHKS